MGRNLQRRRGDAAAGPAYEDVLAGLQFGIGDQHSPDGGIGRWERCGFFKRKVRGDRKTIARGYSNHLRVGAVLTFSKHTYLGTHKFPVGDAEAAATASACGIKANGVSRLDVFNLFSDFDGNTGAVCPKYAREACFLLGGR